MRLTKLYTRAGDGGNTRLADGTVVAKDSLRVGAYGTVDELNSILGMALAAGLDAQLDAEVGRIQNELFDLGADLASPREAELEFEVPRIEQDRVERLEALIDHFTGITGPLENFVLPGGSIGAATLHLARAVCRRAEREVVALAGEFETGAAVIYLNRLSDLLFAMARYENHARGVDEPQWSMGQD